MTGDDERLAALHDHLAATAERPVERDASRWLGEAEALAADVAESDLDPAVVAERLGKIEHLLSHVEGTGDDAADDHVAAAREHLAALRDE